jgi:hypothetical protein
MHCTIATFSTRRDLVLGDRDSFGGYFPTRLGTGYSYVECNQRSTRAIVLWPHSPPSDLLLCGSTRLGRGREGLACCCTRAAILRSVVSAMFGL